jgi:hypothetical protein
MMEKPPNGCLLVLGRVCVRSICELPACGRKAVLGGHARELRSYLMVFQESTPQLSLASSPVRSPTGIPAG